MNQRGEIYPCTPLLLELSYYQVLEAYHRIESTSSSCFEMGSTGSRGAFRGDRMDRLNRIIRESESEDLSPMNSSGSFFAREGSALASPRPWNLTHSFFRCDRRGQWRGGESYSWRGADEDFAATVAAFVSRARSFDRDLHDAGLHFNDYVDGLRFHVSVAESTSSRMRTLLQDAWTELVSAREGLQEAERAKRIQANPRRLQRP
ncbi:hypothetical protein Efla_007439 [Eimeria flavescens]